MSEAEMKIPALVLLLLACGFPVYGQDSTGYINLPPAQFREELTMVNNALIVDVREFFEFKRSRLPGAVNIPSFGKIELSMDTIDRSTHLFFYCTSGSRSGNVAKKFSEKGYPHTYNLDGGIKSWRKEGLPVERKRVVKSSD